MRGLAERDAVPGEIRSYLEEQGLTFAASVWLIRPKVNPTERKVGGYLVLALGVVLAFGTYFLRRLAPG